MQSSPKNQRGMSFDANTSVWIRHAGRMFRRRIVYI
jgi:hypothetical protein